MRVGIIGIVHESNTFSAQPTTLEHFRQLMLVRGAQMRAKVEGAHHETEGFIQALEAHGIEPVTLMLARAVPAGKVTKEAFDTLLGMMDEAIHEAGHLDGLLLAPHGAGVSEEYPDMDGHWLTLVRERFPRPIPLIATCDPHANVSAKMLGAVDGLIAYRTNPHLDQRQRGVEAGELMARTLKGEVRPTVAGAFAPIAINIERQLTSAEPAASMYRMADEILRRPGVLSNSVILGFPYADVAEMGSGFVVVTDNDPALAQACAREMSQWLVGHRQAFVGQMITVEAAVCEALSSQGPVCLLDMGDNVGGGSAGDGTIIAREIMRQTVGLPAASRPRSFVCLFDPAAQDQARAAGEGARVELTVGGKVDDRHGAPLALTGVVKQLVDGKFRETQARHGGVMDFNMGPTAVIQSDDGLTVMLTSRRTGPFSLVQLTAFGIDPEAFQILVAKGVHAPVGGYASVTKKFIRVNTAGTTCADMEAFEYKNRRRPLFPFEEI